MRFQGKVLPQRERYRPKMTWKILSCREAKRVLSLMMKSFWYPLILLILIATNSHAYPDFIGYGYNTCIVCHYNSHGGGPLTDYGRALFSQEIAARTGIPKSVSDEELAEYSGFIPGKQLPYWVRPSIKYRGLWFQTSPGTSKAVEKWIEMQRDVNLVFAFDKASKTILSLTYGMLPSGRDYYGTGEEVDYVSREHYLRTRLGRNWLVAVGLMDKVYGIRTADHSAFNRGTIGFGQNDQVHGAVVEYIDSGWDLTLHGFAGNLQQDEGIRQKGYSLMYEKDMGEKNRLGFSFASFKNDMADKQRFAIHDRWGIGHAKGSSLIFEIGLTKDTSELTGSVSEGNYVYIQSLVNLTRGYNFISTFERIQTENSLSAMDMQKWNIGLLLFPFQRTELRYGVAQVKNFSPEMALEDSWNLQGQVHVSW